MVNESNVCHKHLRSSILSAVTVLCSSSFVTFALLDGILAAFWHKMISCMPVLQQQRRNCDIYLSGCFLRGTN